MRIALRHLESRFRCSSGSRSARKPIFRLRFGFKLSRFRGSYFTQRRDNHPDPFDGHGPGFDPTWSGLGPDASANGAKNRFGPPGQFGAGFRPIRINFGTKATQNRPLVIKGVAGKGVLFPPPISRLLLTAGHCLLAGATRRFYSFGGVRGPTGNRRFCGIRPSTPDMDDFRPAPGPHKL